MIRLCFFRVTDQRTQSWKTVWTHGSQIGICIQAVNCSFVFAARGDLGKHLDGFKVGYSVFCNVALGGWSTSEWETYGLHFCCDHMWVLKGSRMRTPALKQSDFTTDSDVTQCHHGQHWALPTSPNSGLFGWIIDLVSTFLHCSNCWTKEITMDSFHIYLFCSE